MPSVLRQLLASQLRMEEMMRSHATPPVVVNAAPSQTSPLEAVMMRRIEALEQRQTSPRDRFGIPFMRPTTEPR
jgi:hypothetical protein